MMMNMLEKTQLDDGLALAARIRKGDLSPAEALADAIARVVKVNPQLNALAEDLSEQAAVELNNTTPTGPFAGVPILIKDLFTPVAGAKMTNGSLLCKDVVMPFDAEIVTPERRQRIVAAAAGFAGDEKADPDSDVDVLRAWVRLEAVAKARGSGIGVLLTEEGVIGGTAGKPEKSVKSSPAVANIDVGTPYVAAVAADVLRGEIAVRRFPKHADELAEFLSELRT